MKTKDLIENLKLLDPEGELDVVVGTHPIYFIEKLPYYYDGHAQVLVQDKSIKGYNIVGAKFLTKGHKIRINTVDIEGCLCNVYPQKDFPVDLSGLNDCDKEEWKQKIEKYKKEAEDVENGTDVYNNTELMKCPDSFTDDKFEDEEGLKYNENYFLDAVRNFWSETNLDTDSTDLRIIINWFHKKTKELKKEKNDIAEKNKNSLKPCPFCGKIPEEAKWCEYPKQSGFNNAWVIGCTCHVESIIEAETKKEAERLWNTRSTIILPCPFCGKMPESYYHKERFANDSEMVYHIECTYCDVCPLTYSCIGKEDAVKIWNKRNKDD